MMAPLAKAEATAVANHASGSSELVLDRERFRQFRKYAKRVFDLDALLDGIEDSRLEPKIATSLVAQIVFLLGLLRIRSFNALEPRLARPQLQRALGLEVSEDKACSADTLGYALDRMNVDTARAALVKMVRKAERNKVFRQGLNGGLRFVAIDGWEAFSSYKRCCPGCLTREVTVGKKKVTQFYHSFVVALLLGEREEVVLEYEPVLSADVRRELGEVDVDGHEGELTAAKRLVLRLHTTYGKWIEVLVTDALYANGPFFTLAKECGFSVLATLKKENNEPLKEALALWQGQEPKTVIERKDERVELWDCKDITTLGTYDASIRVVREIVYCGDKVKSSWCWAVTGRAAQLLTAPSVAEMGHGRWHLENTGFYQFANYWCFSHVFRHSDAALRALFYIFFLAFNLLQLFVYRHVGGYGRDRGKDPTRTIWSLVDDMMGDVERLTTSLAWDSS
jgi:hypothetical protein